MGQVPRYGIVGGGRVANHLAHYFQMSAIPFTQWTRSDAPFFAVDEQLEGCEVVLLAVRTT